MQGTKWMQKKKKKRSYMLSFQRVLNIPALWEAARIF